MVFGTKEVVIPRPDFVRDTFCNSMVIYPGIRLGFNKRDPYILNIGLETGWVYYDSTVLDLYMAYGVQGYGTLYI